MKPPLACTNCRRRKKKCDRGYPICSYCLKTHDRCSYRVGGHSARSSNNKVPSPPLPKTQAANWKTTLTASLFLGYTQFQGVASKANIGTVVIGEDLQNYISNESDLNESITTYIEIIDRWISFIPRRELETIFSSPRHQSRGEELLVLACIKILTTHPTEDNPRTKVYLAIKSTFVHAEVNGALSIYVLQAMLLLVLYEFGHGIYPCAYITLGTCIRYLAVLGIDGAGPSWDRPARWIDVEIRRRLWWAVFVMERAMALGCPQRPLLMKEPDGHKILPSDELSWEQEYPSTQCCLTIQSPATSDMGNFRLLVLTSHLLGRVFDHLSDEQSDSEFVAERNLQLHRTILALMTVLEIEEQTALVSVTVSRSLLNSALLILDSGPKHSNDEDLTDLSHPRSVSTTLYLDRCRSFVQGKMGSLDTASPFLLHWGFKTFQYYYAKHCRDGRPESQQALQDLGAFFHTLEKRWKLAGVYITLLHLCQQG